MKKSRKGEVTFAILAAFVLLTGYGHYKYMQGDWGPGGLESLPKVERWYDADSLKP